MWSVYMLKCSDGSFYTGIATDITKRLERHNSGRASKYTRARGPVELLYTEECASRSDAQQREIEIKSLSVENKKRLVKFGLGQRFPSALKV